MVICWDFAQGIKREEYAVQSSISRKFCIASRDFTGPFFFGSKRK